VAQLVLDAGGHFVVEGVAEVAHDEADRIRRATTTEAASERVGPESQSLRGAEHSLYRLGRDQLAIGIDAGDGLRADTGQTGDIVERRSGLHCHLLLLCLADRHSEPSKERLACLSKDIYEALVDSLETKSKHKYQFK